MHIVQAWQQLSPMNHTIADDLTNMFNETSREAGFNAIRKRLPSLIPICRMFYAEPAAIRLIRRNGPLVRLETAQDDELLDDDDCVEIDDDSIARPDPRAVRSCRGGSQGCALAGLMACMPYQEVLHGVQRRHPTLRIVCLADDTYINDAPNTL